MSELVRDQARDLLRRIDCAIKRTHELLTFELGYEEPLRASLLGLQKYYDYTTTLSSGAVPVDGLILADFDFRALSIAFPAYGSRFKSIEADIQEAATALSKAICSA